MCVCVLFYSWIFPHWSHIEQPECFWTQSFKLILFCSILLCFTQLCSEMFCVLIWRVTSLVPYHLVWKKQVTVPLLIISNVLGRIPPTTASTPWWVDPPPSSCRFAPRTHNAQAWRGGAHAPCPGALVPGDIGWLWGKPKDFSGFEWIGWMWIMCFTLNASNSYTSTCPQVLDGSVLLEEWHTHTHTKKRYKP